MSANSLNASFLPLLFTSHAENVSMLMWQCFQFAEGMFWTAAYGLTTMFVILPLYVYVLHLGLQRWCRPPPAVPGSHSDVFTYNMIAVTKVSLLASALLWCGSYTANVNVFHSGIHLSIFNLTGENMFHLITCVERYVAVTHPITYHGLRGQKGTRIRNITIGCCWLFVFGNSAILFINSIYLGIVIYLTITALVLGTLSFCSINVICVLFRPQPGDRGVGTHKQCIAQSKRRPVYIMMLIFAVLMLRCLAFLIVAAVLLCTHVPDNTDCVILIASLWLSLPSNVMPPLLYLQRAGKLPGFKCSTDPG